jgi:predicted DNA-binding transcriptional regulator AlpA
MDAYSTREAAKKLRLSLATLTKYISQRKIPIPPLIKVGPVRVRLWSQTDIQRVRELLPKIANGRKTRYQKERAKKKGSKKASKKK